ncbi:MAG: redoxin domain-containing protein [Deltaproteobacteria bacterium]
MPRALPAAALRLNAARFLLSCLFLCASPLGRPPDVLGCAAPLMRRAPEIPHTVSFNTHDYGSLSIKSLRGCVVLVFFWSGSHVGCRRVIEELNGLYARRHDDGFEVIGVHAPNWESLEGSAQYLFDAVQDCGIKFPVVMDESSRIKQAYGTLAVPSLFLIDRHGFIRARYYGEIDFAQLEAAIDHLLTRDGRRPPAASRAPAVKKPVEKKKEFQGML